MQQTPAHEQHNPDLLRIIPRASRRLIEIGCSTGALAREFRKIAPDCDYLGVEIDADYAKLATRYCNRCVVLDVEEAEQSFWSENTDRDCWIFGDALEHLKDPWAVLAKVRQGLAPTGSIVACIPNAQHWSLQARLSVGDLRYAQSGLLDRTHLRWFTRQTIIEMFDQAGCVIQEGFPRIFDEPERARFLPAIELMAKQAGADPRIAVEDALPLQYVVRAVPKA